MADVGSMWRDVKGIVCRCLEKDGHMDFNSNFSSYISFLIVFQLCMRVFSGLSATSYLLSNISNF